MVEPIVTAEAVDDFTLRLTLNAPFYSILQNFTSSYLHPYSQRAVEEGGDDYGRNPVGAGPYMFKEWVQDEKVVLETESLISHGGLNTSPVETPDPIISKPWNGG